MISNAVRSTALALAVTLAMLTSPRSSIADDYSDVVGRMSDPRFDIERYGRAYTKAMRVLDKFLKNRCVDPTNLGDRDRWAEYAKELAKTLHQYASYVEYDEPNVDPVLRQRQEALDMASQLLAASEKAKRLPICPPPDSSASPKPLEIPPPPPTEELGTEVPPDNGQLTPGEKALLKCATAEEQARIQAYQSAIEALQRELDALRQPADDADAEAKAADDEAYNFRSTATEDERKASGWQAKADDLQEKAYQLKRKAAKLREEIQPRVDELNGHIHDTDRDLRDLLDEIRARRSCQPHDASGKTDFLGSVLDNVTIGVGVGGGRHDHRRDHGSKSDHPAPPPHD